MRLAIVVVGATAAAVVDLGTRRIPNPLVGTIAGAGLALAGLHPTGAGLGTALGGLGVGGLLMLPGHLFGRTGAGDVKLLAALGTLLGPAGAAAAFVYTLLAGGVLVVIVAARRHRLTVTIARAASLVRTGGSHVADIEGRAADNRFAYAPAIAVGACLAAMGA
ncbi:MAG: prepilin peptidase [Vicinamibacterales bacterium]